MEQKVWLTSRRKSGSLHQLFKHIFAGSGWGWRHIVTLLVFAGCFINYALRVNLSVGIVAMLNHTALKASREAARSVDPLEVFNSSDGLAVAKDAVKRSVCQQSTGNVTKKVMKVGHN